MRRELVYCIAGEARSLEPCARAIIICARSRQQREQVVHRVLVRSNDSQWCRKVDNLGLEACNYRRLRKFVRENVERDVGVEGCGLDNLKASY